MTKDIKPKKLYQVWKGSNRFFCGGRLVFGPDVASLFLSILLVLGPAIAFCIKTYSKTVGKDTVRPTRWYPVLIVACILTVLDLVFLLLTSGRDPGIVSRNTSPPESEEPFDVTTPSMEWVNGRTPCLKLPRTKDVMVNGHSVKVKYCDTCLLYRPPRASHCSICNNCVQRFDHHCPWVGQCIGIRNYRYFFMFISTATILCVYVFVFSWIYILDSGYKLGKALTQEIIADILVVYCFVAVWFVGGLTVFHSYLICTNQTTYENFRNRYDKKGNPFDRGIARNVEEIFFTKIPPSMNKFRSVVEEGEHMVVGSLTPNLVEALASSKEKIDIEMGAKSGEDGNLTLPEILQNLDFDDESEDSPKKIDEEERCASGEEDEKEGRRISMAEDELNDCVEGSLARGEQTKSILDPIAGEQSNGVFGVRESGTGSSLSGLAAESARSSNYNYGMEDTIMNSFVRGDNNPEEGSRIPEAHSK